MEFIARGGLIKNYKLKIRNLKAGYTIIELVVVMGIVAILSTIGVGGFSVYRNQAMVDAAAEDLAALIRQAQNNSIAIKEGTPPTGSSNCSSQVWTVLISQRETPDQPYANLLSYYKCNENGLWSNTQGSRITLDGYELSAVYKNDAGQIFDNTDTPGSERPFYLSFASPFAQPYLNRTISVANGRTCTQFPLSSQACWEKTNIKPTKEWEYVNMNGGPGYSNYFEQELGYHLELTLKRGSAERKVLVYSNGDTEIK